MQTLMMTAALTSQGFSFILGSMSRARLAAVLVFVTSLALAVLIVSDAAPLLRGPAPETSVWYWPYLLRPVARWWPAIVLALLLAFVSIWWIISRPERMWPVFIVAVLVAGLQLGIIYADRANLGGEMVDRTLSKGTSGYAAVAGEIGDLSLVLRHYPERMTMFDNEHVRTHPPGLVVAFWLTDHALRRWPILAARLGAPVRLWRCTDLWVLARPLSTAASLLLGSWLPVLAGALVPILAWLVARLLYRGPAVALAATLTAVIPALLVFSPTPDQFFALLSLISLGLVLKGMAGRKWVWLALAGLSLSLMSFLSIGNAAWAALLIVFASLTAWRQHWSLRESLARFGALAVGVVSLWVLYWLGWGVAPWTVIRVGLEQHYELVTSQRAYMTWLAHNPLDFLLFTGLSVIVGWGGIAVAAALRPRWRRSEAGLLAGLLAISLLGLNFSGSTRGEVGRLWMVFMPLAALLAGGGWMAAMGLGPLRRENSGSQQRYAVDVVLLIAAQLVLALAIGLAWQPVEAVILPVERPSMAAIPNNMVDLLENFTAPDGNVIQLRGYGPVQTPIAGGTINQHLVWVSHGATLEPYTVFTHVVDSGGNIVAQQDNWPVNGLWPTTCWRPGEVISDPYEIPLPDDLPAGVYSIQVGLYGGPQSARLPTSMGADSIVVEQFDLEP